MGSSFTHLHVHTEYSMLDGASRLDDLVAAAAADGQPALGITDHGNMYGVLDFYNACKSHDINPIIGIELYQAHESRFERPSRRGKMDDSGGNSDGGKKLYYHLIALAENNIGYRNLIEMSSEAFMSGFHYKPRCFPAGQEIITETGIKPIEEIAVGDMVLTHQGRFRPVTQTMSRRHEGELFGVKLNNRYSRTTWMTGEHPVLVRDRDGERSWVEAKDIVPGRPSSAENATNWNSWVCLPKVHSPETMAEIFPSVHVTWESDPEIPNRYFLSSERTGMGPTRHYADFPDSIKLDEEFGYFLGLYVAEGYVIRGEVRLTVPESEGDIIDACSAVIERLVGRAPTVSGPEDRPGHRGVDIRSSSALLAELLSDLCGTGASNKHLPGFIWETPRSFQEAVVRGLFDGDGSRNDRFTAFTQTSETLAWQVRMLRATLNGDFAAVERFELPSEAHADQFRSNDSSDHQALDDRRTLQDDDYVYRAIKDVQTKRYDGLVYNFEVEEDHSYVTDFAVHNCDWELLEKHSEGVIATTGCLGGHVLQSLLQGNEQQALEKAARLQDIFGRDNLFIELQDHGIPEQHKTNPQLIDIARKIQAPILATNDSHYTNRVDHDAHDALLCVQTGSLMSDPDRFKFSGDQHYLKSASEMRHQWAEIPEACDNSLWIAERCNVEIEFGKPLLPDFPIPEGFEGADDYLHHLTFEGARKRWGDNISEEAVERLEFELKVIRDMGFSSYFLITWDMIRYARDVGIRVGPGRGSAAGCAVAYTLWITDLDPIKYDLLFERFLNPSRISMPDIDMDFDTRYRDQMINYCAERYGRDRVAQIVTFGQIKARAAVRDGARVLGYPYAVGDKIAKAMPPLIMGRDTPLKYCFEPSEKYKDGYAMAGELRTMTENEPDVAKVIEVAKGLEGLRRSDGIHAAAVVITKEPLTTYLPIQRKPESGKPIEESPVVTQYEMNGVESLGLLKMDFLGLRNLDVISDAIALIEEVHGVTVDIDHVDLEDQNTYKLLQAGQTIGVFQLESPPMRALMRSMAPTGFEDVAALVALYRPGPMAANMHNDYADRKNGRQEVSYVHPDAEEIMGESYGLMIYQEQMMRASQKFAGYTLAEADNLRKAAGKKKRELMALEREKFIKGCDDLGYGVTFGEDMFTTIEGFADYAFNKSHSYGYGFVSFQTAFLKANYPVEYFASLLTSVKSSLDKAGIYLNECRQLGVSVLVPDVNRSDMNFGSIPNPDPTAPNDFNAITFGLSAVRNVGEGLVELIIKERRANGPFVDFIDFVERVDYAVLNKRAIESLIKAGGFDSLGHARQGLLLCFEEIIDKTVASRKEHDMGVMTLFGGGDDAGGPSFDDRPQISDQEFDKSRRLAFEKEMLGLYVSDHPLMGLEGALKRRSEHSMSELEGMEDGASVVIGGVVTQLQRKWTKKGDLMGIFILEDLTDSSECMVFPRTFTDYGHLLEDDRVVVVRARVQKRDDEAKLMIQTVEVFEADSLGSAAPIRLEVRPDQLSDHLIAELKEVLQRHRGDSPVYIHLSESQVVKLTDEFNANTESGLIPELRVLLGADAVMF